MKIGEDFKLAMGLGAMLLTLNFIFGSAFVALSFLVHG